MRKDCEDFQQKTNAQMIRKHAKQNKVSEYHVGETVLVQNEKAKSRRGKKMLDQIPTLEGKIIKKNNNRYRIQASQSFKKIIKRKAILPHQIPSTLLVQSRFR